MENKMNQILIRRKHKVLVEAGNNTETTEAYVCTIMRNMNYPV